MYSHHKILALIPARSGSKGLPRKNIRDFSGKPLIAWTIAAGLKSKYIDTVYVSTNCPEIQKVALNYGAEVPFLRPATLAADDSEMTSVVKHMLSWITQNTSLHYDYVILLQPTSPLRTAAHIDEALELYFTQAQADQQHCLVSVSRVPSKYNWLLGTDAQNHAHFVMNIDQHDLCRQKLRSLYLPNGAIYISNIKEFNGFYAHRTLLYEMPERDSVDIDFESDFALAESQGVIHD